MSDDLEIPELTEGDFKHMIRGSTRRRIMQGRIESGEDIVVLRRFTKLSQREFARALEISVHTLRNWEQGRRQGLRWTEWRSDDPALPDHARGHGSRDGTAGSSDQ
jgi:DNA-binding XRE family transcriptional regulator